MTTSTTPSITHTANITPAQEMAQLARLLRRVEDHWRTLVIAGERSQPRHTLERMYAAYADAVDAYVVCQRALARRGHQSDEQLAS